MKINAANRLTILRVFMIPLFLFALWSPWFDGYNRYIAAAVFSLASLTDLIDGWVARRFNQITNFGKFMDPLADKLLVSAALIALTEAGEIAAWITIIIISREFIVTGIRVVAAERGVVIAADGLAKIKTTAQLFTVIFFILQFQNINSIFDITGFALLMLTVLLSVVSACGYIVKNISIFNDNEEGKRSV